MSQIGVTKDCKCIYCGAGKKECVQCGSYFYTTRKGHLFCSDRCRTRKSRNKKAPS